MAFSGRAAGVGSAEGVGARHPGDAAGPGARPALGARHHRSPPPRGLRAPRRTARRRGRRAPDGASGSPPGASSEDEARTAARRGPARRGRPPARGRSARSVACAARRWRRRAAGSPRAGSAAPAAGTRRAFSALRTIDRHGGRHAGHQPLRLVVHGDDRVVGDDVLGRGRLQAHLLDAGPRRSRSGKASTLEGDLLARAHTADVGLVDRGVDLHLREVVGDHEEHGRLEGGGHRLADVDVARDHDTVDRGGDDGVAEVHLGLVEVRLRPADRRLVRLDAAPSRRRRLALAVSSSLAGTSFWRRAPGRARTSAARRRWRPGTARRWPGPRADWPGPGPAGRRRSTARAGRSPGPSGRWS